MGTDHRDSGSRGLSPYRARHRCARPTRNEYGVNSVAEKEVVADAVARAAADADADAVAAVDAGAAAVASAAADADAGALRRAAGSVTS